MKYCLQRLAFIRALISLIIVIFLITNIGICESGRIISKLKLPSKTRSAPANDPTIIILRTSKVNLNLNTLLKTSFSIKLDKKLYHAERSPRFSASFNTQLNKERYITSFSGRLTKKGNSSGGSYFVSYYYSKKSKRITIAANFKLPNNKEYSLKGYSKGKKHNITFAEIKNHSTKGLDCKQNSSGYLPSDTEQSHYNNDFVNYTSNPVIKLLIAYTPDALVRAGGTLASIQTIANFEIARLNQSLQDSGVNLTVQNACTPYAIPTSRNDDMSDVLALYENGDGWADGVHQARINCSADLVHLMYGGSTGGGYGNIFGQEQSLAKASRLAFSGTIINNSLLSSSKGFAHEIGHNLGCAHHTDYTTGHGYYTDSHGHRFTGNNNIVYTDIMTYVYPGGQSVNLFSNPNITHQGVATGVLGAADLAKTLNVTGSLATQFRNYLTAPTGTIGYALSKSSNSGNILVTPVFNQSNDVDLSAHEYRTYYKDDSNNWVYHSSKSIDNPYGTVHDSTKTWKIALYPDTYITTPEFNTFNASSLNISASLTNNVISGNITDSDNNPVNISGNWVQVQFRYAAADPSTPFETLISITPTNTGAFSHTVSTAGYYRINIVTETGNKSSSNFLYSAPTTTPTRTSTPASTSTSTPTYTAIATNTPSATTTPTATFTITSQPTLTATPTPTIFFTNTAIPTINVPTSIPIATPTPFGGIQYSLSIKQKKVGKTKVMLTGILYLGNKGVPDSIVKLKCNKSFKALTNKTDLEGSYKFTIKRPISGPIICSAYYKESPSAKVKILPFKP